MYARAETLDRGVDNEMHEDHMYPGPDQLSRGQEGNF